MRFMKDRRGATAVLFALSAIPLIGLAGLGTEAGMWYAVKRHAQNAADASALAGAITLVSHGSASAASTRAAKLATADGFTNAASPSASATQSVSFSQTATSVTATISQTQPMLLAPMLCIGRPNCSLSSVTISATATASISSAQPVCMLALSPAVGSGSQAPIVIGGSQGAITGTGCSVMSSGNIKLNGSLSGLAGGSLFAAKGCSGQACSSLGTLSNWYEPPPQNPLARLDSGALPTIASSGNNVYCPNQTTGPAGNRNLCVYPIVTVTDSSHWSLQPGTYGSVTVSSGTLTLSAGTYYINTLNVTGGTLALSTGKYFLGTANITGGTVNDNATVTINADGSTTVIGGENIVIENSLTVSNATINLTAHTDDTSPLNGVLIYDRQSGSLNFTGNSSSTFGGALYFPNADLTWGGNSRSAMQCTEIIAYTLAFQGNTTNIDATSCPNGQNGIVPRAQTVLLTN